MSTSYSLEWVITPATFLKNQTFILKLNGIEYVTLFLTPTGHWYVVYEQEECRLPEKLGHSDVVGLESIQKKLTKEAVKFANAQANSKKRK